MTDDIVTRLRAIGDLTCYTCQEFVCGISNEDCCKHNNRDNDCCHHRSEIISFAADEIERLRRNLQLMSIDYRTQIAGIKMRCKCGACK